MRTNKLKIMSFSHPESTRSARHPNGALSALHAWIDAVNRHDLEAIVEIFAPNASFFGTSTQTLVTSSEGIRQYFDVVLKNYVPLKVTLGLVTVSELSPDSAVITGYDKWQVTLNGESVEAIGRLSVAVALRDNHWRIISFHRSAMPD
jgi:uncharacterized protein (TIGR02246 family)